MPRRGREADGLAGVLARQRFVAEDGRPVHEDIAEPDSVGAGLIEGGLIGNPVGVEDNNVGCCAGFEFAAAFEAECPRGQGGHLADGCFEGERFEFAHVSAEHAGVVAIAARMRQFAVGRARAAVAGDHGQRVAHEAAHVRLVHAVVNGGGAAVALEIEDEFDLLVESVGPAAQLGGLRRGLAVERLVVTTVRDDNAAIIIAQALLQRVLHLRHDARLLAGVVEPLGKLLGAALAGFVGNETAEAGAGGGVGVLVMGDVESAGPRTVEQCQNLAGFVPCFRPGQLEMRDLGANLRLPRDTTEFVQRVEDALGFMADMAHAEAAVGGDDPGQFDELVRLGERAGQVDQPRAETDREPVAKQPS